MKRLLALILVAALLSPGPVRADGGNPKTAFFLSLLLPGAGELYSGYPSRAAAFAGVEAVTWLAWYSWRNKGYDLRDEFRVYADRNWSEASYLAWQDYNRSQGSPYFETHHLPSKTDDTQQYYELIGKYNQFVFGWSDVNVPLTADEQEVSQIQSTLRSDYEEMRNESNKYLKRSSVVIGLAVVNHIASAIHASAYARSRRTAEKRIWVELAPVDLRGRSGATALLSARF